ERIQRAQIKQSLSGRVGGAKGELTPVRRERKRRLGETRLFRREEREAHGLRRRLRAIEPCHAQRQRRDQRKQTCGNPRNLITPTAALRQCCSIQRLRYFSLIQTG